MSPQEIKAKLQIPASKTAGFFDAPITQKVGSAIKNTIASPTELRNLVSKGVQTSGTLYNKWTEYSQKRQQEIKYQYNLPAWLENIIAPAELGARGAVGLEREIGAGAVSLLKSVVPESPVKLRSDEDQKALEQAVFGREVESTIDWAVKPTLNYADKSGSGALEKYGLGALALVGGIIADSPIDAPLGAPFKKLTKRLIADLAKEADEKVIAKTLNTIEPKLNLNEREAGASLIAKAKTPEEVQEIVGKLKRLYETRTAKAVTEAPQVVIAKNAETGADVVFRVRNADLETVRDALKKVPITGDQPVIVTKSVEDLLKRGFEDGGVIGRADVEKLTKQVGELKATVDDFAKPVVKSPSELRQAVTSRGEQPRTKLGRYAPFEPNKEARTAKIGEAGAKDPDNLADVVSDVAENSLKNDTNGVRQKALVDYRNNPDYIPEKTVELREIEDGRIVIADGRHALEVARETGVTPKFIDVTDQYPSITGGKAKPSKKVADLINGQAVPNPSKVGTPRNGGVDTSGLKGKYRKSVESIEALGGENNAIKIKADLIDRRNSYPSYSLKYREINDQVKKISADIVNYQDAVRKKLKSTRKSNAYAVAGAPVGLEVDDQGNINLDPTMALLGVLGVGAIGKVLGKDAVLNGLKKLPKWSEVESQIYAEFDIAEAGFRYTNDAGEVVASPSTFPKWVPEDLREKKLMTKVLRHISEGTVPKKNATREQRLYDAITEEFQSRLGVAPEVYTNLSLTQENSKSLYDFIGEKLGVKNDFDQNINGTTYKFDDTDVQLGVTVYKRGDEPYVADDGREFVNVVAIDHIKSTKSGTGKGTEIVKEVEDWADKNGYDVVINNDSSDGYWEAMGYEPYGLAKFKELSGAKSLDANEEIPDDLIKQWDEDASAMMQDTTDQVRKTVSGVNISGEKWELEKMGIDTPIPKTPKKAMSASQGSMDFFELPPETVMDKIKRTLHDKFRRLEVTQKAIGAKGKEIPEDANAFLQQELYVGRTAERIDKARNKIIRDEKGSGTGLLERMRTDGVTIEDLGRYMHAKHAGERNAKVRSINEDLPDGGSGLTDAEAKKILDEFKGNETIAKYADEFRETVIKERIRILREEGLMTEEAIEKIEKAYENYVPLKVLEKTTRIGASGKGFSAQGKDIKRVKGSTKERSNPVIQAIVDLEDTIIKAEKNKVGQSFLKLVRQNPNKELWEVEPLKYTPRYNKEGEVIMLDPKYKFADNVMEVREGGKVRLVTIKDQQLARAMKNLGTEKAISKVLMAFNSYLRGVVTFYNPEFMVTNFQRDIQTALINVGGEKSVGLASKVAKDIAPAMRGIYREARGKKPAIKKKGTDWQAVYKEMKEEGGRVGWFDLNEVGERTSETIKLIERYNSDSTVASLRRGVDALAKTVSDMNESVEMAVRVSTYKNLVDSGLSKAESARYAKNLTVNFNKKGNWGVALNSLYLFANAGIQGSARVITALKYPKVRAIVAGIAGSAYALNHLNEMINSEGYNRLSDFEKDTNLILMLPPDFTPSAEEKKFIGGNDKDGYYLKLKQPYGYNIFKVLGDSAYNMTSGKKTVGEEMKHLMLALDSAFNPLSSGSLTQLASPTITDPIVQQLENKNWFGGAIKPDQPAYQPPVRESSLYFKGATEQSKAVAEWLNRVTGGNEVEAGFIDISPEIIDHYVDFMAGGVGDLFNATVDTSLTLAEGDLPDVTEMPFIRKFIDKPFEQAEKFEMYDLLEASATKKLAPVQRERFIKDVKTALETEQIDEDTAKKVLKDFSKNEAKIKAGELLSLYLEGNKEEALQQLGTANSLVEAEFKKLLKSKVEEKLQNKLEAVNN